MGFGRADERSVIRRMWAAHSTAGVILGNNRISTNELLDVVKVKAKPDYRLELEFENGERRVFDMAPLMDAAEGYGCIPWRSYRLRHGCVAGQYRYCPRTLYDRSVPLSD